MASGRGSAGARPWSSPAVADSGGPGPWSAVCSARAASTAPTAIALTRASRHGTIENDAQERFVATWTGRVGRRGRGGTKAAVTDSARESLAQRAEHHVHDRLRAALPAEYILLPNVAWIVRHHGTDREGEADLVIAHPELGFLTIEVKAGTISRDSLGRWWAGGRQLDRAPFQQAADSRHSLVAKLLELPDWPAGLDPIAGHAVAFPSAELDSLGPAVNFIGPDSDPELILDKALLAPGRAVERAASGVGRSLLRAVVGRRATSRPGRRASSCCARP